MPQYLSLYEITVSKCELLIYGIHVVCQRGGFWWWQFFDDNKVVEIAEQVLGIIL